MLKKFLLSSVLLAFLSAHSHAGLPGVQGPNSQTGYTDTTAEKKDSLVTATTLSDPKQGFKDLFIPVAGTNGISMDQLNPMAVSFVEDYVDKFGKKMENIKANAKPYFDMMDAVLAEHGLPKELKYLAVIESYLQPNARSWAGAVGPWQFMPATARNMGLKVNRKIDERRDIYKSTHAASRYLASLFSMYGDWLLVIAAYNGGPGAVNSAIRRSGSHDFWMLQAYLPQESRNHVKKFIATHYIMEGTGGITTLTKTEAANLPAASDTSRIIREDIANARLQYISGRYNGAIIAKHLSMEMAAFNKLNPDFDKFIALNGNYGLYLPNDKMDLFVATKLDILRESIQLLLNPDAVSKSRASSE